MQPDLGAPALALGEPGGAERPLHGAGDEPVGDVPPHPLHGAAARSPVYHASRAA